MQEIDGEKEKENETVKSWSATSRWLMLMPYPTNSMYVYIFNEQRANEEHATHENEERTSGSDTSTQQTEHFTFRKFSANAEQIATYYKCDMIQTSFFISMRKM